VVAAVLPNLGHIVADNSTTPRTSHFVQDTQGSLSVIGMALVPLALIVVGALWVALLEFIG
jgi:hypothetical protein